MKIRSVQPVLLSYPFPEPIRLPYHGGERTLFKRDAMVIRVETDQGLIGYAPGEGSVHARDIVSNLIAPFLIDKTIGDPDALRVMFARSVGAESYAMKVWCSVEIGLYDLLGQARGIPVSEMITGRVRDRIRLYGSAGMYMSPEEYAREAEAVAELGFRAYKMRPALGPEEDVRTVRLMRESVGGAFDLMVDAHTWWRMGDRSYSYETVERVASEIAEFDIAWLEEPLPPHDHQAYKRLRDAALVPLASGEHEPDEDRYLDLILTGAVDYVQMDVVCQGGYPTGRRIMPEIARENLRFAFHSFGTALEVVAAAHLGICWPESVVEWLEYPCYSTPGRVGMYPFPLAAEILTEPLEIDTGDLVVSRAPGLGVRVDERVFDRYPWIEGPWSSFSTSSPPETRMVTGDHSAAWGR
ncbi:MAG TPA: mandelate racemase/muconate lactonizing enzyme family protein [Bryobacteraceae bacterium]|nr:mandelate racemase/muconate lactonizing enzyme family protein [Bryobacteraceae bacterium]